MFLPALLYIADALLWWFAVDIESRWDDNQLTTVAVVLAVSVLLWAWVEHFQLLTSDDDE